tara:strand:- start:4329 stop:4868 length:540 start_codon:yes stop_codon:yes gene_type:complete
MKLTNKQLRQIIKEELQNVLREAEFVQGQAEEFTDQIEAETEQSFEGINYLDALSMAMGKGPISPEAQQQNWSDPKVKRNANRIAYYRLEGVTKNILRIINQHARNLTWEEQEMAKKVFLPFMKVLPDCGPGARCADVTGFSEHASRVWDYLNNLGSDVQRDLVETKRKSKRTARRLRK